MSVNIVKDSISENPKPTSVKFHVQVQGGEGMEGKFHLNGPGHMTKMAATSIYGINLMRSRSFSPVPLDGLP